MPYEATICCGRRICAFGGCLCIVKGEYVCQRRRIFAVVGDYMYCERQICAVKALCRIRRLFVVEGEFCMVFLLRCDFLQ